MRRSALAATLAAGLAGACGGGGGGGDVTTAMGALDALPDPGGEPYVVFTDLAAAAELAGEERPGPDADVEDQIDFAREVAQFEPGEDVGASLPTAVLDLRDQLLQETLHDAVGISFAQIDGFAELQDPPDSVVVLDGRFDVDEVADAVGEQPGDDGLIRVGDGGGFDPDGVGILRGSIGAGAVLDVADDRLVVARSDDPFDEDERLGDDEALPAVADALDEAGAYAGAMRRTSEEPFDAVATGVAADADGEPILVIAFAYDEDDDEEAEDHADALEELAEDGESVNGRPWDEILDDPEVVVAGTVVVLTAEIDEASPQLWFQLVSVFDNLVGAPDDAD